MSDGLDDLVDYQRRQDAWLLDWRGEIEGVARYATTPVNPAVATRIDSEHIVPRLGPVLTAMAREARLMHQSHLSSKRLAEQAHPADITAAENRAWGAKQVLALGLGAHLDLSVEHANWLAEGLIGYELDWPALQQRRHDRQQRGQ